MRKNLLINDMTGRQRQNQVLVAAALLALGLYGCGLLTLIF